MVVSPFVEHAKSRALMTLPSHLEGIMKLPTRQELTTNSIVFGCLGLLPVLSPTWASTSLMLGFAVSLYLLYNRETMPTPSNAMSVEARPAQVRPGRSHSKKLCPHPFARR